METSQAKWFTLIILVPKRLDQQDHFKVSLRYTVNTVPIWINNMASCPRASKPTHKQTKIKIKKIKIKTKIEQERKTPTGRCEMI